MSSSSVSPSNPLIPLFNRVQSDFASHSRSVQQCVQSYTAAEETFLANFFSLLERWSIEGRKDSASERLREFLRSLLPALFSCDSDTLVGRVMEFSINHLQSSDKCVRGRMCEILEICLASLPEEFEISEALFDKLSQALIQRTRDRAAAVRGAACRALTRLQGDSDGSLDPVAGELIRLMTCDSSAEVRRAAVQSLSVSSFEVLQPLLMRVRDVSASVRRSAFLKLKDSPKHFRLLQVQQRATILRSGLSERDAAVKRSAVDLICENWLRKCDQDAEELIKSVGVEFFSSDCELMLQTMAQTKCWGEKTRLPPYNKTELTAERALIWRVKLQHDIETAKKRPNSESLISAIVEAQLPELVELVELISFHRHSPFLLLQLLQLSQWADLSDESGRRELNSLLKSLLIDIDETSDSVIPAIMKLLRIVAINGGRESQQLIDPAVIAAGERHQVQEILEVLSEIRDPIEEEVESRQQKEEAAARCRELQAQMKQLNAEKEIAIKAENFTRAAEIKVQMQSIKAELAQQQSDEEASSNGHERIWLRMLLIVSELLLNTQRVNLTHPGVAGLLFSTIIPALNLPEPACREFALKSLALYLLLDASHCRQYFPILRTAADPSHGESLSIQLIALKAIADSALLFDGMLDETELAQLSQFLCERFSLIFEPQLSPVPNSVEEELQLECIATAGEGLCKLLLFDRFPADAVSTPLLAISSAFFHPALAAFLSVQQCFAVFFQSFASQSADHRAAVAQLAVPMLKALEKLEQNSEAQSDDGEEENSSAVNLPAVGQFIVSLIHTDADAIDSFIQSITAEIRANPREKRVRALCQWLSIVPIGVFTASHREIVDSLSQQSKIKDKLALKALQSLQTAMVEKFGATETETDWEKENATGKSESNQSVKAMEKTEKVKKTRKLQKSDKESTQSSTVPAK